MTDRVPVDLPVAVELARGAPRVCEQRRAGPLTLHRTVRARLALARTLEADPPEIHGFRLETAAWLYTFTGAMARWYFRTESRGLEQLPSGRVLLIANHGSHVLSWDGANIITACLLDADPPRLVHGMGEHRLMTLPVLGRVASRIGAVDGQRATCIAMLRGGAAVLAFPEGARALQRRFAARYQVGPFGHGFAHAAIAARAPVVPVAVIGCEEEAPLLANPQWIRRLVGTPVAPITPTLLVPLPVRYRLHFGAPLEPPLAAGDAPAAAFADTVRAALIAQIDTGLAERRHVFW